MIDSGVVKTIGKAVVNCRCWYRRGKSDDDDNDGVLVKGCLDDSLAVVVEQKAVLLGSNTDIATAAKGKIIHGMERHFVL
jgi:hypothetical protein